ncbi:MAG: hypothetical protein AAGC47_12270 [Bacteroidota bacterium]
MKIFDASKTTLKAIIWTTFTYFDIKNKKMAVHSAELENLFKEIAQPIEKQYFEQRYKAILANLKLQ